MWFMVFLASVCFVTIIYGQCIEPYPNHRIDHILNDLIDPNIYYLGHTNSSIECLNDCIGFNYLCDLSDNESISDEWGGPTYWDPNNDECSLIWSLNDQANESFELLTSNIIANQYTIETQLSVSDGSNAGIIFKAQEPPMYLGHYVYLNFETDKIKIWHYTKEDESDWVYDYNVKSPISLQYNIIYALKVDIANNQFTIYLNEQFIYSSIFPPLETGGYAGLYLEDYYAPYMTTATFYTFTITYPNSNDNDDQLICAAYTYNNDNNECFGYYGNDNFTVIEDSIVADNDYKSGILYETCTPTKSPSKDPSTSNMSETITNASETNASDNGVLDGGVIALIVIGCIVLVIVIIFVILFMNKYNKGRERAVSSKTEMEMARDDNDNEDQVHKDNDKVIENDENEVLVEVGNNIDNKSIAPGANNDNTTSVEPETNLNNHRSTFVVGSESEEENGMSDVSNEANTIATYQTNEYMEGEQMHNMNEINETSVDCIVNEKGAKEVQNWLKSIGFSQYTQTFVSNGFDSLDMIKEITNKNDLKDIGITLAAHQLKLWNHIKKLQNY